MCLSQLPHSPALSLCKMLHSLTASLAKRPPHLCLCIAEKVDVEHPPHTPDSRDQVSSSPQGNIIIFISSLGDHKLRGSQADLLQ